MGNEAAIDVDAVRQRLKFVLGKRRPYTWGQAHGLSRGAVGRMLKGILPTPDRLLPAVRAENLSLTWLLTGQGTPYVVHTPTSDADGADLVRRLRQEMGTPRATVVTAPGNRVAVVLSEDVSKTDPDGGSYSYTHLEVIGGMALGNLTLDQLSNTAPDRRIGMETGDWQRLATGWMSASELSAYKPKLHVVRPASPRSLDAYITGEALHAHVAEESPSYGAEQLSESERRLIDAWRRAPDVARDMVIKMLESVT